MKTWIVPIRHQFSTCMACYMDLFIWAFESIPRMGALSAFLSCIFIIRSWKVWSSSCQSSSTSLRTSCRRINYFWFRRYFFTVYFLLNVNRIMPKDIFLFCLLLLFIWPFLFRMSFKVVFDYTVENRISNCSCYLFTTTDALLFFSNN